MSAADRENAVLSAVAVHFTIQAMDALRAMEVLPTPEALLNAVQASRGDFNLVAGVALALLRAQGVNLD